MTNIKANAPDGATHYLCDENGNITYHKCEISGWVTFIKDRYIGDTTEYLHPSWNSLLKPL